MRTITTTFQTVKSYGEKSGKCGKCGKRTRRARTFEHSMNPWNKNTDGIPKTYKEVLVDVDAERDTWIAEELVCTKCE